MALNEPVTELDARFSGADARAVDWAHGRRRIEEAELFWLSTVRPGRPAASGADGGQGPPAP